MVTEAPAAEALGRQAAAPVAAAPPKVSFGVPVRNGAPHIELCLKALLAQTLDDIEVVVSDNASTDATERICREIAAADPRVRYIRQERDIGMAGNFRFVAEAARAAYFVWRAHDDLSLPDYAEKLSRLLDAHPEAALAVGRVHWDDQANGFFKSYKLPDTTEVSGWRRVARQFVRFTPHWYYGMYRREAAIAHLKYTVEIVGERTFHADMIGLCRLIAAGRVVTSPVTVFVGRRVSERVFDYASVSRADLFHAMRCYWRTIRSGFVEGGFNRAERAALTVAAAYNMNRRLVRLKWLSRKHYFRRG
jgi:glycosyltransferase involved in cell wall biosynthesis